MQILKLINRIVQRLLQLEKYGDENIYLNVNASGNNFLFLGDTYVGKGWKAYVDGNQTTNL